MVIVCNKFKKYKSYSYRKGHLSCNDLRTSALLAIHWIQVFAFKIHFIENRKKVYSSVESLMIKAIL